MLQTTITQAINSRGLLGFAYDDKPRVIEPHAIGINKAGYLVMRGYQVDGQSATNPRSWKLFTIDKIEGLTLVEGESQAPREGYRPGDTSMVTILAELPATLVAA